MHRLSILAIVLTLGASGVSAKPKVAGDHCRDAIGHFIACKPVAAPAAAKLNCKVGKACGGSCIATSAICKK